jgi:predicted nucleotidyltransferase
MNSSMVEKQVLSKQSPRRVETFTPSYMKLYRRSERYLKKLLRDNLPMGSKIFLFGSRARGNFTRGSDIDIGVMAGSIIDPKLLVKLSEIIDESFVPFKVDIVDFETVDESFREEAMKRIVQWK